MRGATWVTTLASYGVAQVALAVGAFIKVPLIIGAAGANGYGVVAVVSSIWVVGLCLIEGVSQTVRIRALESAASPGELTIAGFRVGTVESLVLSLLLIGFTPVAVSRLDIPLGPYLAFVLFVAAAVTASFGKGLLEAAGRTALVHGIASLNVLVSVPLTFIFFHWGLGLDAMIIAAAIGLVSPTLFAAGLAILFNGRSPSPPVASASSALPIRLVASTSIWTLSAALAYAFDPLIVALILDAEQAGTFGLVAKIMSLAMMIPLGLAAMISGQVTRWRASLQHRELLRRLARMAGLLGVITACVVIIAASVGPYLLAILSQGQLEAPTTLYWLFGLFGVLSALTSPFFAALAGNAAAASLRGRTAFYFGLLNIALSSWLTSAIGILGPAVASILCIAGLGSVLIWRMSGDASLTKI